MAIGKLSRPVTVKLPDGGTAVIKGEHHSRGVSLARVVYPKAGGRSVKVLRERCAFLMLQIETCETVRAEDGTERPSAFVVTAPADTAGAVALESLCECAAVLRWHEVDTTARTWKPQTDAAPHPHIRPDGLGAKRTIRFAYMPTVAKAVTELSEIDPTYRRDVKTGNNVPNVEVPSLEFEWSE